MAAAADSAGKRKLRILCFGDSLTSGYAQWGAISHPYEGKLKEKLEEAFAPDLEVETNEDGQPGDITGFFMGRIQTHFEKGRPKYDWTIVLGGTNDLAYTYTAEVVFENLQKCWSVPLANGSKVLALTVPEVGMKSKADEKRSKLNALIRGAADGKNLFVHDHHVAVPFWSLTGDEREKYWDDNVHLTADGYDLMGEKIAERLVEILREQQDGEDKTKQKTVALTEQQQQSLDEAKDSNMAPTPAAPPARRSNRKKAFKDDDISFEEEAGDSKRLARGYVVVRKKDLE